MKKVSVIVLSYNSKFLLENCLSFLFKQTYKNFEVIVVDNASENDYINYIKKTFHKVKIIRTKKNIGASARNLGIDKAKGEYIIFLDNDVELEKSFIKEIVETTESDERIGMISPTTYYSYDLREALCDEFPRVDTLGIRLTKSGLTHDIKDINDIDKLFCPCTCACFYKKELLDKMNKEYFDKDYFCYADDFDIGFKGILLGYKCVHSPKAIAYHIHSATMGLEPDKSMYLDDRNRVWTIIKNYPKELLIKNLHWILLLQLLTIIKQTFKGRFLSIFKSKLDSLYELDVMLEKRKFIQANKKIDNKELNKLIKGII